MTSFGGAPPSDRAAAARFLLALMDGRFDDGMAMLREADASPYGDGREELICGLGWIALNALTQAYGGPIGAMEQLQLQLLDVSLEAGQ